MSCSRGCCATQAEHYRSIAFSAYATPTRRPAAVGVEETERRWHKDMPAYKALVEQGVQPKRIDGCHELAQRAEIRQEVEAGVIATDKQRKTAQSILADMG